MITMSRRKQSNPKPHKPGDEDACWGGNGENEKMPENLENGYGDKELLSSSSPSCSPTADYHRKSVSPVPKATETASAVVPAEPSSSPTGNCTDSPAVSTGGLRINALLATDPAKRVSTATATVKLEPPSIPDDQVELLAPVSGEQSVIKRIVNATSSTAGCVTDTQVNNADVKRQSPLTFVAIKNEHAPTVALPANFSLQPDPVISSQSVFTASRILNCPGTSQSSLPAPSTVSCSVVELPRSKVDASTDTSKQGYLCSPCGIKFSSLSTLEAHQTYYCSHRPKKMSKGSTESESEDSRTFSGYDQEDSSGGETMAIESPVNKACKTGKQYRCTHCSYSADKKVSLNRHMRMHSVSPATNDSDSAGPASQPQQSSSIDRYCQECDIRFSNLKTFRAHKMHYCSTRNVIKQAVVNSSRPLSPSTLPPTVADPMAASLIPPINIPNGVTGVATQPPFLALPTNPILIVPYSLMQGASVLSTPLVSNVASQNAVYFLLPDGSLQLVTQSVQPLSHNISNIASVLQPTQPNQILQTREIPDGKNSKIYPNSLSVAGPLDLSLRKKSMDRESEMYEEDKENRHHEFDNTDDHEDIVCAPSIPLLLSTSSNSSTPSPSPLSPPAPKLDKTMSSPPAPKLSPNPPPMSKSPKRVFNGVIKNGCKKDYLDGGKVVPEFSPGNGDHRFIADVLFSAAAAAATASKNPLGIDHPSRELPFSPDILSYLAAQTAAAAASSSSSATRRSPATTTPLLLPTLPPQTAPPSAQNLPFLTSEMVRLAAASNVACPASPFIRQGMWKCEDCHIGFCKYENYLAHKKHYCSTRNIRDGSSGSSHPDDAQKTSPAGSPVMKPSSPAQQPTVAAKDGASPPASNPIVVNQNNATNATTVVPNTGTGGSNAKQVFLHVVCNLCGIKFTSLDNLTTHQAFYCTKRNVIQETADKSSLKCCSKCKALLPMDELPIHQCGTVGNAPAVNSGGWKCPCCFVTFATADAVQKHIQSHNGIKAFLCTICNYKGNTIRGMRSHIRVHFNKRNVEVMEENYITCVLEENSSSAANEDTTASSEKKSLPNNNNNNNSNNHNNNNNNNNNNKSSSDEIVCNGEATRRQRVDSVATTSGAEEDDDEYIDVGEISPSVKTENLTKSLSGTEDGSVKEHRSERRLSPVENSVAAEDSAAAVAINNNSKSGENGTSAAMKPGPLTSANSNYCESCNISFNYLSTFIAHKKYYCTTKRVLLNVSSDVSSPPPLNSIEPISVPIVNVTSEAAIQII